MTTLQLIVGGGFAAPMKLLAETFELDTGHRLVIRYAATPELIEMAKGTSALDLAVVPREVFDDADAAAHFLPGSRIEIAHVGLGVAVRAGAPRPDIGTADAFRQALLAARSVAYLPGSASGAQITRIFERLGIAGEMKMKIKAQTAPAEIPRAVAEGRAELALFGINVLTSPGVELVGPFPAELQQEIVYSARVCTRAQAPELALTVIDFLKTPAARNVVRAQGLTPS